MFLNTEQTNIKDKDEIKGYVKALEKLLRRDILSGKGSVRV